MKPNLYRSTFIFVILVFYAIISVVQTSAQSGTSVISPELQQTINQTPNDTVLITITLNEQPIHDVSQKIKQRYESKLNAIQSKIRNYFLNARNAVLLKKNIVNSRVKKKDESSIDINSGLTNAVKQVILNESSKYERTKQEMNLEILNDTGQNIKPQQNRIMTRIAELGGYVVGNGSFYNVIFARMPADKINIIAGLPDVGYIEKTGITSPDMDTSAYSIYANTFWNGYLNGTPFIVGVADTGVDSTHPALSTRVIAAKDMVPNDSDGNNPDDLHGHGTHVSGTVASTDSVYKGIAYGAKIINIKVGNANIGYSAYDSDVMAGVDWAISRPINPADIISHSYSGNSYKSRYFDAVVDDLGVAVSLSAGNSGPNPQTVTYDSYNAFVVGAMNDKDSINRVDDTIASYSSRGPVPGTGRIKPDIIAPGSFITSAAADWEGPNPDFVTFSGTSMAAPHIAGASSLLKSAGVFDPKEIKALMINTAEDRGSTGGDFDYGWGYVDLNHAFFHSPDVRLGVVNSSNRYLLYKGYSFPGDSASLVWNLHVNYSGPSYPGTPYDLSNLDMYLYNESDGTLISYSGSYEQNVEQVISNANTSTVLKINAYGFAAGLASEEFALATEEGFNATNLPGLRLQISTPGNVTVNESFNVSVNITNVGDISAHNVNVSLSLPSGFMIISGQNYSNAGSISPGKGKNASWTVNSSSHEGIYSLTADFRSFSYNENYSGSNSSLLTVDPQAYINGSVFYNGAGVKGALVTTDTNISSITDSSGNYSLAVSSGSYNLTAIDEPVFYPNSSVRVIVNGMTVMQDIELSRKQTGNISGMVRIG